jgi:hypothetical protein
LNLRQLIGSSGGKEFVQVIKEETALQKAFGAVKVTTTTVAAIKLIYTVLHYLIKHWPDINHFFHGLDTNSHINYWNMYREDCSRVLTSRRVTEQEANDLVIEFNKWFPTLPHEVQGMVFEELGRGRIEVGRLRIRRLTKRN